MPDNKYSFRGLKDLRKEISILNLKIPLEESVIDNIELLRAGLTVEGKIIPNRLCSQPMEGCDAEDDGSPSALTFRRYKRLAKGGVGLIWVEATAVVPQGKANRRQLHINRSSVSNFKKLADLIRKNSVNYLGKKQNPFIVLQLTHSGRYSKPEGKAKPVIFQHSKYLDPTHKLSADYPLITDPELDELLYKYVEAAKLAKSCGFDAVDIKSCHGYLIDEILGSHTRTDSKYGGSYENRIKFLADAVDKIKKSVPGIIVTTRLNVYDAIPHPYGFGMKENGGMDPDMTEPVKLIKKLRVMGVSMVNVCFGNPYYNPHIERPYDYPVQGFVIPDEHPLKAFERNTALTEEIAREIPEMHIVATGFSWLRELYPHLGVAMVKHKIAEIIGVGRGAFANPDFANELLSAGELKAEKTCVTCSSCTQIMRDGGTSGCVIYDREVYGPIYTRGRLGNEEYVRSLANDCRTCWGASCKGDCPAGMDIPGFIKTFAEGDLEGAYKIMHKDNILPETCSYVCPTEVLCEKNCNSDILNRKVIPIHEIQKFIAAEARKRGITKVIAGQPKGRRVAVIGFGPAGISCAVKLIEKGYSVTVFESGKGPGGTANKVIPSSRLPFGVVENEVAGFGLEETGLFEIRYGKKMSGKLTVDGLFKEGFDGIFIGAGLTENVGLDIKKKPKEVVPALDFLGKIKKQRMKLPDNVAVIGGGNTAMDAACSAKNSGVRNVYLIYRRSFKELPAWEAEVQKALQLGVHFLILNAPVNYIKDKKGKLKGIKLIRTELGKPDASGRASPVPVKGSGYTLPISMCIEAVGQGISDELAGGLTGVKIVRGKIATKDLGYETSREKVFAAGDIINGGKTVVLAVKEGMEAAEEITNKI